MAFVASKFALPENPITRAYESCGGLGNVGIAPVGLGVFYKTDNFSLQGLGDLGDCGCGCHGQGGPGSCQDSALQGLGDLAAIDLSSIGDTLTQPVVAGVPMWMFGLGAVVIVMLLSSRGSAEADYRKDLKELKAKYPRRGTRYARAAKAGYEAGRAITA
jgi:hypothetical protein